MTVDYSNINQLVVLIAAAVPTVAPFLEHINMFSSTWYIATDVVNVSLFLPSPSEKIRVIFTRNRQKYTFTVLPWGY